jgi:drug/metabolite transporter (DMT)-like permease
VETFWLTGSALVCFAANSLLCRLALESGALDPGTFTSVRLLAGALTLALLRGTRRKPVRRAFAPGLLLFAYAGCFSLAYAQIGAGTGALLLFAAVQATMVAGGMALGEPVDVRQCAGLLLAFSGVGYLVAPGIQAPPLGAAFLMIAAGIAWGIYSLLARGASDSLEATADSFAAAVPISFLLATLTPGVLRISLAGLGFAVASGALASGVGYVLWHRALKRLTASGAASVQLLVPVLTALGGWVFLSEPLSFRLLLSTVVVLGGIGLTVTAGSREGVHNSHAPRRLRDVLVPSARRAGLVERDSQS